MTVVGQENIPMENMAYVNSRNLSLFNQIDTNNDGYISMNELRNYYFCNESECVFIPKKIIKKIKQADSNGQLNFQEFEQFLQSKDFMDLFHKGVSTYIHHLIPHPKKELTYPGPMMLRRAVSTYDEESNLCNEYSCCPPPIFMFVISLIELGLFLTDELTQKDSTLTASGVTGKYLLYDPYKKNEFWRFCTYMFVHIGYAHIIVNLIVQLLLGIPLEMVNKWWRVLMIYFLGGIAGCLAHAVIDGTIRLGGASGGVYALITAHLAQVLMNWSDLPFAWAQLIIFGLIITIDLGQSAYNRYYQNIVNEIGVTCHLGGALAGLLVGIYIIRNVHVTTTEKFIWWAALVIYIVITTFSIIFLIFT